MKDSKTGTICTTGKDSKTCNTHSCEPTVTRVGDYVEGLLVPLNSTQVVVFTRGIPPYDDDTMSHEDKYNRSYVDGQVINISSNGSVSFGPVIRLTSGRNALGVGNIMAAKVDNNRIVLGGASRIYKSKYDNIGAMMVRVNGNNLSIYNKQIFDYEFVWYHMIVRVRYIQGGSTASIDFYGENTNGYPYRNYYSYNVNDGSFHETKDFYERDWNDTDARYFTDVESLVEPSPSVVRERLYAVDNFTPLDKNTKAWEAVGSFGDVYGISVGPASANYRSQYYVLFPPETYSEYGSVESMTHFGNSKFVALTSKRERIDKKYVYNKYLLYFKNENGTWKRMHAIKAPDSTGSSPGDLIAINDTYAFYNSEDGLYLIKYDG